MPGTIETFESMDLSEEIKHAITSNGISFLRIEFLRYSVNKNYKVVCQDRDFFLRIYRPKKENREQIQAEHDFLLFLKKNNFNVAAPVTLMNETTLEEIQTQAGPTHFALFEFLKGSHPTDLNEFSLNWGRSLGRLHSLSHYHTQMVMLFQLIDSELTFVYLRQIK